MLRTGLGIACAAVVVGMSGAATVARADSANACSLISAADVGAIVGDEVSSQQGPTYEGDWSCLYSKGGDEIVAVELMDQSYIDGNKENAKGSGTKYPFNTIAEFYKASKQEFKDQGQMESMPTVGDDSFFRRAPKNGCPQSFNGLYQENEVMFLKGGYVVEVNTPCGPGAVMGKDKQVAIAKKIADILP